MKWYICTTRRNGAATQLLDEETDRGFIGQVFMNNPPPDGSLVAVQVDSDDWPVAVHRVFEQASWRDENAHMPRGPRR